MGYFGYPVTKATDIVAYTLDGEILCPRCTESEQPATLKEDDYGPNPVFASMIEEVTHCGGCGDGILD